MYGAAPPKDGSIGVVEAGLDKTLLKGLQVLSHLAGAERPVRITDVAREMALTKSNAYRVLRTLEAAGYVRQDPLTKDFRPSLKLWELGMQVVGRLDLRSIAADVLKRLAADSRETVHLAVLDGLDVIYIDKIDSPEPVSAYTRLGGRAPAYCVATGKALLSQLPASELDARLTELHPHSRFTITDPEKLREELAGAERAGYAVNRGEWRESVWGVAAAVRDPLGTPTAAVGVSGPSYRIDTGNRCEELARLVKTAAADIHQAWR
jgi:IclR family KDG regulon transcriptional repressor